MDKEKVYFIEIVKNKVKYQMKTLDYDKIIKFVRMHRGSIDSLNYGHRIISKEKLKELDLE